MFGYTVAQIGKMLKLPRQVIWQRFRSMGYTKKIYSRKDIKAMIQDYSIPEGMKTVKQIAKEAGVSIKATNARIEYLGLEADGYRGAKTRCFNADSVKKIIHYRKPPEEYYTAKQASSKLGVSGQVVAYRMRVLGIGQKFGRYKLLTEEQLEVIKNFNLYKDKRDIPKCSCAIKMYE